MVGEELAARFGRRFSFRPVREVKSPDPPRCFCCRSTWVADGG